MNQVLRDLIYLDRCALNETLPDREVNELEQIFALAKKHSIVALTAAALPNVEKFQNERNIAIVRYLVHGKP